MDHDQSRPTECDGTCQPLFNEFSEWLKEHNQMVVASGLQSEDRYQAAMFGVSQHAYEGLVISVARHALDSGNMMNLNWLICVGLFFKERAERIAKAGSRLREFKALPPARQLN